MFDVGFSELLLVAVVLLLVIGPEKLPETLRTVGLWFGRLRRSLRAVKSEIEHEIGMDNVRHQLRNEATLIEKIGIEKAARSSALPPAAASNLRKGSTAQTTIEASSNSIGTNGG